VIRERTIAEIQGMLKHMINNPLCAISMQAELIADDTSADNVRQILASVDRISGALRNVSEERLRNWQTEGHP